MYFSNISRVSRKLNSSLKKGKLPRYLEMIIIETFKPAKKTFLLSLQRTHVTANNIKVKSVINQYNRNNSYMQTGKLYFNREKKLLM